MSDNSGKNAYTIIETLQRSRKYCVYKARNYFSGRNVIIKSNEQRWRSDEAEVRQLRDEAEAGLRLKHPQIRETIGLFEESGSVYMVCEYLQGDSLNDILQIPKVDISYSQAIKWTLQLLDALEYAHKHLILHLNINPSNIIIDQDYELKVFGFGKSPHSWKNADAEKRELHPVLFTPPEVFLEENPDERSDLYSVGVMSYLLLRGKLPWDIDTRESPSGQKQQTFTSPVLKLEQPGRSIPAWLFNILNKALMLDPAKRFASAAEMREAIAQQRDVPYEICTGLPQAVAPKALGAMPDDNVFSPHAMPDTVPGPQPARDFPDQGRSKPSLAETQPGTGVSPRNEPAKPPDRSGASTVETPGAKIHIKAKATSPEVKKLQKTFRILLVISSLILIYIIFKYVLFKKQPGFNNAKSGKKTEKVSGSTARVANKTISLVSEPGGVAILGYQGPDAENDEFPLLELQLSPYLISAREITREQWAMVFSDHTFAEEEKDLPITGITFDAVVEYCNEKSRLDGYNPCYEYLGNGVICDFTANGYRLPTEAEWEYAAKARRREDFNTYSGSSVADVVAWYSSNSGGALHPVGQKQPNQLGLYDLSGNAAEWVWNWYAPYSRSADTPLIGPDTGTDKVIRGGSFKDRPEELRVTKRSHAKPYTKANHIGFRVVRTK